MNRKNIGIIFASFVILALIVPSKVSANSILKSTKGRKIDILNVPTNETALLDTDDFYTLYNEINDLKIYLSTMNQIPEGTYFYKRGTEGTSNIETYKKINGKFYRCDENGIVAEGTTESSIPDNMLGEYQILDASDLIAGIAAFKNNHIVLGNGISNQVVYSEYEDKESNMQNGIENLSYQAGIEFADGRVNTESSSYKSGYNQGYEKGLNEMLENGKITKIYHVHKGDSLKKGGCYTIPVLHVHVESCKKICEGTLLFEAIENNGSQTQEFKYICDKCDATGETTDTLLKKCKNQILICNKTESTIESYGLSCNKTEEFLESLTIIY